MTPAFTAFHAIDKIFIICGALGALVVLVRAVLFMLGGALDGELDGPGDGEADAGDGFRFLSLLGLSSFFMMFGLVGIALRQQSGKGMGWSLLGGVLAGMAALWVIARLFRLARRLQSSGNILPQAAAGCLGTVYLTIPPGKTGRVSVRIGQRLREMDAVHDAGTELPTGTPVRVVRVERSLAIVQPLSTSEISCPNR